MFKIPESLINLIKIDDFQIEVYNQRPQENFLQVNQIHSAKLIWASEIRQSRELIQADGIISLFSSPPLRPLAIKTADCLPVMLIGRKGHAAIHAGWKGLKEKILIHPDLDRIEPQFAIIGPHIKWYNYQVQADFKNQITEHQFFRTLDNQLFFDLEAYASEQLVQRFKGIKLLQSQICTYEHPALHSYRRNKTELRNWTLIRPTKSP